MKLHYSKILLFALALNILLTSYYAHNKNKACITTHTRTTTSRVLIECDIHTTIYDNDADMKSVKENFDRRTSQRFEEYDERMNEKRQKSKEQRDKNVQKIIEKDKIEKSLTEKVEKGCLRCGCGLGGVAAGIGIIGGIAISELKKAAMATAIASAKEAGTADAKAKGAAAFKSAVIEGIIKEFRVSILGVHRFESLFTANTYPNASEIAYAINTQYDPSPCVLRRSAAEKPICNWVLEKSLAAPKIPGKVSSTYNSIEVAVESIITDAKSAAAEASEKATEEVIQRSIGVVDAKYVICQNAIIASVVALLIIVLVMIIIYLVLRYRRKKKMNKKQQYTKLLNQ
ncbi:hypothetical protein PFMALIP_00913 [Plasmodium falciparum MaliPS096_E11]|uniref:Surface antigen n=1 Tax=Plasmodium falciparum MaliPS096_E11 TaxID=1036727 RepID=A0A024WW73_PLAFA|nr:hypothetical protein PFMALIP_00913 [Plasmodium falciparum MaliPS096_E11]